MNWLIAFISLVLVLQIVLFFVIRAKKKKDRENSILVKYNIKSPGDAFRLLNDPEIDAADKEAIEKLYNGEEDSIPNQL